MALNIPLLFDIYSAVYALVALSGIFGKFSLPLKSVSKVDLDKNLVELMPNKN